jgi:hypothetical protein
MSKHLELQDVLGTDKAFFWHRYLPKVWHLYHVTAENHKDFTWPKMVAVVEKQTDGSYHVNDDIGEFNIAENLKQAKWQAEHGFWLFSQLNKE